MERLSMCRICVSDELPLRSIVNTHLHEIYEYLTKKPFVTEGKRPIVACDPCCASLKDCYELRSRCLSSEKRFTQLLKSKSKVNKPKLPDTARKRPLRDVPKKIENDKVKETQAEAARDDNSAECAHQDAECPEDVVGCRYIKVEIDVEHEISDDDTAGEQDDVEITACYVAPDDRSGDISQNIGNEGSHSDAGAAVPGQHGLDTLKSPESTHSSRKTNAAIFGQIINADKICDCSHKKLKPYSCSICQKCFSAKKQLTRHMHTHSGAKPFQCDICKKCFTQKSQLSRHIPIHTGEKPYQCHLCKKRFIRKSHLELHVLTHTGGKPYRCDICRKCFNRQGHLDVHIRTHTGEKPYECNICQQRFMRKNEFNIHLRTHTGEKPYQCHVCKKPFHRKDSLDTHILTHTSEKPYSCDVCKKCFKRKDHLDIHMRTHSGVKPYTCKTCKQRFIQKRDLNIHMRSHTGEKPYHCTVCEKYFSRKEHLVRHSRTHTPKST